MKPRAKRVILLILRWALCIGALAYVLSGVSWGDYVYLPGDPPDVRHQIVRYGAGPDNRTTITYRHRDDGAEHTLLRQELETGHGRIEYGVGSTIKGADQKLLLLGLAIFLPAPFLAALRLLWMLRAQEIQLTWWESIKLTFAGNFFNFAIPGTTGGDVFKAYYIAQHTDRKTEAVTTVFLDRAVGLVGLCLLGGMAILFRLDDPELRKRGIYLAAVLALLALAAVVFFSRRLRALLRLDALIDRLPLKGQVRRIDKATFRMRHHKGLVVSALLLTGIIQGFAISSFTAAGKAMGMTHSIPAFFAGLAAGLLVAAIPLTPMSAGTMEAIFVVLFVGPDASASQALFLALAVRLIQLCWALPGVLVPLTGAHRPSPDKLAELDPSVASDTSSA